MIFIFFGFAGVLDAIPAKNCRSEKSVHYAAIEKTCENFNIRDMITVRTPAFLFIVYLFYSVTTMQKNQ